VNLKNIFTLRTVQDGINIKEKMLNSKKVVLIGGGYISIELLEAFVHNNLQVTLIEKNNQILKMLWKELVIGLNLIEIVKKF
jgi:NADPH-dependent 2,4-dienoyl-CoA reductase/sulfur reductase-like enzyme